MEEKLDDAEQPIDTASSAELRPARFGTDLRLPPADVQIVKDAASAIRQEYRDCSKWKRLRCRKVSIFAERDRGTVYVVHIGKSIDFDWTWEGATAFRPMSLDDNTRASTASYEDAAFEHEIAWQGEVIEVDERNGCLFISLDHPEAIPSVGSFFVRPFEFLSVLDSVLNDCKQPEARTELAGRLAATRGGIHPVLDHRQTASLPHLRQWWQHSWCVLWGPPGTGKTYTTGQQIATVLDDPTERILVVSTTNGATDAVAVSIGNAAAERSRSHLAGGNLRRIGKGASLRSFASAGLDAMLAGTESETLRKIDELARELRTLDTWEEKALTRKRISELRSAGGDQGKHNFVDSKVRVVVTTAFKATSYLKDPVVTKMLEEGNAPFTTIFIDEAGLMSRTAIAALSLLAARRVVLVGDSKQLAPISRISRVLPPKHQMWLASSGLSHLDDLAHTPTAVHVLSEQRRMHPDVCRVVSNYQYGGFLKTAPETNNRDSNLTSFLANHSRAIWYVLDEEPADLASIRAERGPGNKSWVRSITNNVLEKLFHDTTLRDSKGTFISPFKAQAQVVANLFSSWGLTDWESSTVHSQQGAETDIVVFDTVNAGSYSWPYEEWKRLVNVALSRAREAVIVLASRSEMEEPYLKPLRRQLTASRLVDDDRKGFRWQTVSEAVSVDHRRGDAKPKEVGRVAESRPQYGTTAIGPPDLGDQFRQRKAMRPVLSHQQQRIANLKLDGRPRLVRGVAGSGKSIVLCTWLAKTVQRLEADKNLCIWAVYANRSLHKLLRESVETAWANLWSDSLYDVPNFPWEKVSLLHVKDVLAGLLPEASLSMDAFEFDYDRAAEEFLKRQASATILPRCSALFIDEAQDMGPSMLKLLLSLVQRCDAEDANSTPAHIFYDNAQNIYGRKTPKWSDFGIDLRGRSAIMRENFRSTNPIAELAVNMLHRLAGPDRQQDQHELLSMGLIEKQEINDQTWLSVRFNQIDGPKPIFRCFKSRVDEINAMANHLRHLIDGEGVSPSDICIIYNGKYVVQLIESILTPILSQIGVELSIQTNRPFERKPNTLVVTTSHSYKGYESEVVMIPGVDLFVTGDGQVLANNLYVAMTRARSLLFLYACQDGGPASRQITRTLASCIEAMDSTPSVDMTASIQDDLNDILDQIGTEHRAWLIDLWKRFEIRQEPLVSADGSVLAEPLFWFLRGQHRFACVSVAAVARSTFDRLRQSNITCISPGDRIV